MTEANPDYSRKWYILLAISMGIFLATIDGGIVNIGLNTLVVEFGKPLVVIEWVVLAYMLTISVLMLSMGRLGDMFGKKNLYLSGMIIFTIGSLLCGLSPTIYWLISFRVLQAIGASIIMALASAMVIEAFPDHQRGKALGFLGTLVSIGIIAGPTFGGLILQSLPWHWLFFVNIPIGIIGVILVIRTVPHNRPGTRQKFDLPGALTLLVSLGALLFALSEIQLGSYDQLLVYSLFGVFAVALAAFIYIETHTAQPMVDLKLFRNRLFTVNLLTSFLTFVTGAGTTILLPLYLQNVLHYEPGQAGLLLAVTPLTIAMVAPLAGSISDRKGSRVITSIGLALVLVGNIAISTLSTTTTALGYILRFIPLGIGLGLFQSPNNSAVMGSAPRERSGVASGLLSLTRTVGQVTGIAVLGAFWERRVIDLAQGFNFDNVTYAPVTAQATGLQATLRLVVVLISFALLLSLWALWTWRKQRRNSTSHSPADTL